MIPGEIIISDKELEINSGSEAIEIEVSNADFYLLSSTFLSFLVTNFYLTYYGLD